MMLHVERFRIHRVEEARMKFPSRICVLIFLASLVNAAQANTPQQLASDLQAALRNGDMDAELTLLDRDGVPGGLLYYFVEMVVDCVGKDASACKAVVLPPGDEASKKVAQYAEFPELEVVPALEGFIKVSTDPSRQDDAFNTRLVPYAKVKGEYRLLEQHLTAKKLAEWRAQTAQSITDALLTKHVPVSNLPKGTDWKAKAQRLPNGGGEAGAWFVTQTSAIAAAYKARDVAALRTLKGEYGESIYREKDYNGKPVSQQLLQLTLRAQAVRAVMDATVLGGYQLGDTVALTYEGHDGTGWIVRGCKVLKRKDNEWEAIDDDRIEIPSP